MKLEKNVLLLVIGFQFVAILGLGGWIGKEAWDAYSAKKKGYTRPAVSIEAEPVALGDFETFATAVGVLKANESIVVKPEEGGIVSEILFQSGDLVQKGDVLIRLDDRILRANLKDAEAKLKAAAASFERYKILLDKKVVSEAKYEENEAQYEEAQAKVELIQAQLDAMVLKAPFEGIVGIKDVSVGAYLKAGEDVVTINDVDPIKVDFNITEAQIDKLKVGEEVEVTVEGFPENIFPATIEAISPIADETGHSIRVRAVFSNPGNELKPGLFARVKFPDMFHEQVMVVPETAIESQGHEEYVYAIIDGVARRAPIKTGARDGQNVEVLSGLKTGIMVATSGHLRLQDGTEVVVMPPNTEQKYA